MCVDVSTFEEAEDDHKINSDVEVCKTLSLRFICH